MKQSNVTSAAAVVVAISIPGLASNYSIRSDIIEGRGSNQQPGWIIIDNDYFDQTPMTDHSHNTL